MKQFGHAHEVAVCEEMSAEAVLELGEVRVQLLASPVNPADLNFIEGRYGVVPQLPFTPGMEGCGEVLESQSPNFEKGDKVIFLRRGGAWQEELICGDRDLVKVPRELDALQAAMLGVNPMTAHMMLSDFVDLQRGDVAIQNGANSGVGQCVIQLAREMGITLINTVRREGALKEIEKLGAENCLLDDASLRKNVISLGLPAPRLAMNCVGGRSALTQLKLLGEEGTQITFGAMAREPFKIPNGLLIFKRVRLVGFWVTKWLEKQPRNVVEQAYGELADLVLQGNLEQKVCRVYGFDEIATALEHAAEGERGGKIILSPDSSKFVL